LRLLVYDRQPARLGRVRNALRQWQVQCVHEPSELLDAVCGCAPCAVAVALEEPGGAVPVLETIAALKQCRCAPVCYAEGAHGWAVGVQCRLVLAGASRLLDSDEPGFEAELAAHLEQVRQAESRLLDEDARLQSVLLSLGVVGQSPLLLAAYRWVMRASPLSDLPALLLGETGTGKELLAHAIHQLDPRRRNGPFVAVNCAAISPGVAESELFGHRRGAYTGAQHDRRGLVRAADGGVLFLDEVGELDESLQGKLLRVLQQGRVLAVGEDREVAVDVRVVAATNRDLEEMVERGTFRADLYHRLHVLPVRVPPLRERPEDVAPLVRHFMHRHAGPCAAREVTDAFLAALRQARLPGNVRQLENLVNGVLAGREDDRPLDLPDLPPEILAEVAEHSVPPPPPAAPARAAPAGLNAVHLLAAHGGNLARALEHCEGLLVQAALAAAGGNQSRTARMLGITPRSVYNKIRKHHLGG
jgi:transcriptional regulator with GAF, ATPase, and Fis domain